MSVRYKVKRSKFGWWVAYNPDAGDMDSATFHRALTRNGLLKKLERRRRPARDIWETVVVGPESEDR